MFFYGSFKRFKYNPTFETMHQKCPLQISDYCEQNQNLVVLEAAVQIYLK